MAVQQYEEGYIAGALEGWHAHLTTCTSCMPAAPDPWGADEFDVACVTCMDGVETTKTIRPINTGPDGTWPAGEDITQVATRSNKLDRWPYQIFSEELDLACQPDCVYLARIQYELETSSTRRSFFQCGFSDIWLVERYDNGGNLLEMFVVATSLPMDIQNDFISSDYTSPTAPGNKITGSTAHRHTYFNPYGLRERYDERKINLEPHSGTLVFFVRGNDKLRFRLAQHTNLHEDIDINPLDFLMENGVDIAPHKDYLAAHSKYEVEGSFHIKFFTRPVPGNMQINSAKDSEQDEGYIKYHPRLFS